MDDVVTATLADLMAQRDRLLDLKDKNNLVMASCKQQIETAKAGVAGGGDYADPAWFAAVNTRARFAGREDQRIAGRLAKLGPLIKEAKQRERRFVVQPPSDDEPIRLLVKGLGLIQEAIDLLRSRLDDPGASP